MLYPVPVVSLFSSSSFPHQSKLQPPSLTLLSTRSQLQWGNRFVFWCRMVLASTYAFIQYYAQQSETLSIFHLKLVCPSIVISNFQLSVFRFFKCLNVSFLAFFAGSQPELPYVHNPSSFVVGVLPLSRLTTWVSVLSLHITLVFFRKVYASLVRIWKTYSFSHVSVFL